jgi:hypothetical protein
MDGELEVRSAAELERLQSLAAAAELGPAGQEDDLLEALEGGFAWLIWLEAMLSRSAPNTGAAARLPGLIEALRIELSNLLALARSEPSTWRTLGFVLPAGR